MIDGLLDAAIGYAARGWRVLPVHAVADGHCSCGGTDCSSPGKHPRTKNGVKDASTDAAQVRRWWKQWPGSNVGIATGGVAGLVVIDVDGAEGEDAIAAWEREGPAVDTLTATTGKGRHLYFVAGDAMRIKNRVGLAPALDVRAEGGYVVAPPSVHASGRRYEWTEASTADPAPLPVWLHERIVAKPRDAAAPLRPTPVPSVADERGYRYARAALARECADVTGAKEGTRNDRLNAAAFALGRLVAAGYLGASHVTTELLAAALRARLPEGEARKAIASGLRAGGASPRELPPLRINGTQETPAVEQQPPPVEPFPTVRIGDVPDPGKVRWLIHLLWTADAFGIVGALPKAWKTYLTYQIAISVATGRELFGRFAVKQGLVLIFAAEGGKNSARRRIGAICRALDVAIADLDIEVFNVPSIRLDREDQAARFAATVEALQPALVIVDPLREVHGGDENAAEYVAALLAPIRALQERVGCAVLLVHHFGKPNDGTRSRRAAERLRGSGALAGAVDSALFLEPKGDGDDKRVVVTVMHRDAREPDPFTIRLRVQDTPDGEAIWLELVEEETTRDEVEDAVAARERARKRVIETIAKAAMPGRSPMKSKRAITRVCRMSPKIAGPTVDELIDEKLIHVDEMGAYRPGAPPPPPPPANPSPSSDEGGCFPVLPTASPEAAVLDRFPLPSPQGGEAEAEAPAKGRATGRGSGKRQGKGRQ